MRIRELLENPNNFEPEHYDAETEFYGVGDDGEETSCTLYFTYTIVNGNPVVHPKSLHLSCPMDGNSKLGYDADMDLEMQDMDEIMAAAKEAADEDFNEIMRKRNAERKEKHRAEVERIRKQNAMQTDFSRVSDPGRSMGYWKD